MSDGLSADQIRLSTKSNRRAAWMSRSGSFKGLELFDDRGGRSLERARAARGGIRKTPRLTRRRTRSGWEGSESSDLPRQNAAKCDSRRTRDSHHSSATILLTPPPPPGTPENLSRYVSLYSSPKPQRALHFSPQAQPPVPAHVTCIAKMAARARPPTQNKDLQHFLPHTLPNSFGNNLIAEPRHQKSVRFCSEVFGPVRPALPTPFLPTAY